MKGRQEVINELDEKPRLHFNDIKPKPAAPGDDQEDPSTLSWYDGAMLADEVIGIETEII